MRALPIAAAMVLGLTAAAAAQMLGPGMNMPGFNTAPAAPPPGMQQPQQAPPCVQAFMGLRDEAAKRAGVLKAAQTSKKKPTQEEACGMLKRFSEAEAKVVKYMQANVQSCSIPPAMVTQAKQSHGRTLQYVDKICNAATAGPRPQGPGLSEALGTARGGTLDPLAPQSGALDTLNGNVLAR